MAFRSDRQRRAVMMRLISARGYPKVRVRSSSIPDPEVYEGYVGKYTGMVLTDTGLTIGRISGFDGYGKGEASARYLVLDTKNRYPVVVGVLHQRILKSILDKQAVRLGQR